jgi:hypothetical protein
MTMTAHSPTEAEEVGAALDSFEDRDVVAASVRIKKAGDGLSAAMHFAPVALHIGDTVFVVLECTVGPVSLRPIKDTNVLERVHDLIAGNATYVDEDLVRKHLDEQAARLAAAREKALAEKGILRLPFATVGDEDGGDEDETGPDADETGHEDEAPAEDGSDAGQSDDNMKCFPCDMTFPTRQGYEDHAARAHTG